MNTRSWILGGTIILLVLVFRFLLPLILPFVLAYFCARIVSPVIRFFTDRLKWRKKVATVMVVVITVSAIVGFIIYIGSLAVSQLILLLQRIPVYGQMADQTLEELCCHCDQVLDLAAGTSYQYLETQTTQLYQNIGSDILPKVSSCATDIFMWAAGIGTGIFMFIVSTLLILLDDSLPRIPDRFRPFIKRLKSAGFAYIKAQGIIIFLIAVIMSVGFMLIGNEYAILVGIGVAIFDAFPVMGSGIVLIPWALIELAGGHLYEAAVLITLFVIATFLREILEPKLLGKGLGMKPLYVLISIYVGVKLFGIGGILLGPVALAVLKATDEVTSSAS